MCLAYLVPYVRASQHLLSTPHRSSRHFPHTMLSKWVQRLAELADLRCSEVNQNKVLKNARRKLLDAASSFGALDSDLRLGELHGSNVCILWFLYGLQMSPISMYFLPKMTAKTQRHWFQSLEAGGGIVFLLPLACMCRVPGRTLSSALSPSLSPSAALFPTLSPACLPLCVALCILASLCCGTLEPCLPLWLCPPLVFTKTSLPLGCKAVLINLPYHKKKK